MRIILSGWWYNTAPTVSCGTYSAIHWGKHTDKVAVLKVVAVQLVARLLRIHHVFIDDEGGALGVARDALSNLTVYRSQRKPPGTKAGEVDVPDGPVLPKEVEQLLWSDVVAGPGSAHGTLSRRESNTGDGNTP